MNTGYMYPIFRSGQILQSPISFTHEAATAVREKFWDNLDWISEALLNCFKGNGIEAWPLSQEVSQEELDKRKGPHRDEFEGPALHFEHLGIRYDNFVGEFKASLTICSPPNQSKNWLRFSFTHKSNPGSHEFDSETIRYLFDKMHKTSNHMEEVFFDKYREFLGTNNLKRQQTILVKSVTSNDDSLKEIIDLATTFSEKDEKVDFNFVLERLPYWLSAGAIKSFEQFEGSIRCFGLSACDLKRCHKGIFLKCDAEKLTDYVSLGYSSDKDILADYRDSCSHNISKALVRDICFYI